MLLTYAVLVKRKNMDVNVQWLSLNLNRALLKKSPVVKNQTGSCVFDLNSYIISLFRYDGRICVGMVAMAL